MKAKKIISIVMAVVMMLSVVFCAVPTVGAKSTSSKKATLSLSDKFIALYTKGCDNTIVAYGSLVNKNLKWGQTNSKVLKLSKVYNKQKTCSRVNIKPISTGTTKVWCKNGKTTRYCTVTVKKSSKSEIANFAYMFQNANLNYFLNYDTTNSFFSANWSAMFVSFVMKNVSKNSMSSPTVSSWVNDAKRQHRYHKITSKNKPHKGDLVVISKSGYYSHIGIVHSVKGNNMTIVEGNVGSSNYINSYVGVHKYNIKSKIWTDFIDTKV